MLELHGISKEYKSGDMSVQALKEVSISFRRNEFVAILGPSGCGKTTLLNIIGGLDRYSGGDLVIKGKSTKQFKDRDWDSYRNHSVGFVFQSYNLIPHQTVLSNVEIALTISGVSGAERRRRAVEALQKVGLGDQMKKKPNQMSGGQMQRVAIARALVNDPEILLADEPTGALDSETSVQIMDVLKEIARDRLVIMVTHNPELAESYATRIVRLLDGRVQSDTMPFDGGEEGGEVRSGHTSMSFMTALHLSLNNLMTKKGRTFMVGLAGSIGIIGIALIMSLSGGINQYIKDVEEGTLSSYPLNIQSSTMSGSAAMLGAMTAVQNTVVEVEEGYIHSSNAMAGMLNAMMNEVEQNDLASFKVYLEETHDFDGLISGVKYEYDTDVLIYNRSAVGGTVRVNPSTLIDSMTGSSMMNDMSGLAAMSSMSQMSNMMDMYNMNAFFELSEGRQKQYELLTGRMPQRYDELLLVVGENHDISDTMLYTLGLRDQSETAGMLRSLLSGQNVSTDGTRFSYDELMNLDFTLVLPGNLYQPNASGVYENVSTNAVMMEQVLEGGMPLRIVGIARSNSNSLISDFMSGGVGYLPELTEYVVKANGETDAVRAQRENEEVDIFTGLRFDGTMPELTIDMLNDYIASLPEDQQKQINAYTRFLSEEKLLEMARQQMKGQTTNATYRGNLSLLSAVELTTPSAISIYPVDFASKEKTVALIEAYNARMRDEGHEERVISYTDYVGALMSSVTTIVNAISYVLIAFVSISLVVSSIMIGIITYISVLERTKEIGILRAMGASKKDVSRVFTAETLIIGLIAGLIGIVSTILLNIPITMIIRSVAGINATAALPAGSAGILVLISMLLTVVAGFIPARMAAKKDPVVALRTE